jgi:hypothetical protein
MRRLAVAVVILGLVGATGPAAAVIGAMDEIPAATLLVPYFEVSLDADGVTTLFAINNAASSAVLTNVTVWSDQGVVVLNFQCYLTGFDVVTMNLRDVLVHGRLCRTASDGQDPVDTISPQGLISEDVNVASCTGVLPYPDVALDAAERAHVQAWLLGNMSPATGNCAAANIDGHRIAANDRIMRGYVTVDTVNACNLFVPTMLPTYDAFLTDQNVLWGDYFIVHPGEDFAQGETLVHLEACVDPEEGCPFAPGEHTFYGRYAAATAIDQREPLPTTFLARFVNGGAFDGGTSYLVWREGSQAAAPYHCSLDGPSSSWYPLPFEQLAMFDEEENPVVPETCPIPSCEPQVEIFNLAQRVSVADHLFSPFDFGWVLLNLQHGEVLSIYGDDDAQAWMAVVMDASGRFSVGFDAVQVDNANDPYDEVIPVPE